MLEARGQDRVYAEALNHVRDDHAVIPDSATTILKPDVGVYFDRNGDWQSIVNLTSSKDVEKMSSPRYPPYSPRSDGCKPNRYVWGEAF